MGSFLLFCLFLTIKEGKHRKPGRKVGEKTRSGQKRIKGGKLGITSSVNFLCIYSFLFICFSFWFSVNFRRSRGDLGIKKGFRKGAQGGKGNKKDEVKKELYD